MADYLPEDVTVRILGRLPTKSLIRFTCVSKRWRFIILSDSHFAKSQFQIACEQQTLSRRLLLSAAADESEFESLDSEETLLSFGDNSTVSKLRCPFQQPGQFVRLLSSCNGLVCALLFSQNNQKPWKVYIWNPSTRFFKKLPLIPSTTNYTLLYYGFGHFSATDEYKVVIAKDKLIHGEEDEKETQAHIFSSKADIWRRTESPDPLYCDIRHKGILSNEALHWVSEGLDRKIVAFDIAAEKFRTMPLPDDRGSYFRELGVFGGCLCAFDDEKACTTGFIDLWVMKKYDAGDSWTKLFTLKVSNQPEDIIYLMPIMVMETSTILEKKIFRCDQFKFIRSGHKEEKLETHMVGRNSRGNMIEYEESLLWFETMLKGCGLLRYVDGSFPCPPRRMIGEEDGVTSEMMKQYMNWEQNDVAVMSILAATLSTDVLSFVVGSKTFRELWCLLQERYASTSHSNRMHLKTNFQNLQKGSDSIDQYLLRVKIACDQLANVGVRMPDEDIIVTVIHGLPSTFATMKTIIREKKTLVSLQELRSLLLIAEDEIELVWVKDLRFKGTDPVAIPTGYRIVLP